MLFAVSMLTLTSKSMDRLLALLLGRRCRYLVEALIFFRAFSFQLLKLEIHRDDHSSRLSTPAVQMNVNYVIYTSHQMPISCTSIYQYSSTAPGRLGQNCNLLSFFRPSIPKRALDTKKTTANIEVRPESLGAMLDY